MAIGQLAPSRTTTAAKFSATGGTITTSGSYTIHTFTSSGTFTPNGSYEVEYLIVAGGGGGGYNYGGGGGAGGVLTDTGVAVTAQAYTVTVGEGGAGGTGGNGTDGGDSSFAGATATGGGAGGGGAGTAAAGGSGGGGHPGITTAGAGTEGQGHTGGVGTNSGGQNILSGGGGGASEDGGTGTQWSACGDGGDGVASSITGTSVTYGGGGGGGGYSGYSVAGGSGGAGGGGAGSGGSGTAGTAGTDGTGGGGGGGAGEYGAGGDGGNGVVIIRYLTPADGNTGSITGQPELNISYESDVPIYAELFSLYDGDVWNGTAYVSYSSLADTAAWQACLIPMIEQALADDTLTGHYQGGVPDDARLEPWGARFFHGTLATLEPSDEPIGTQTGQTLAELVDAAKFSRACVQTAINDASATTTSATLDYIHPIANGLAGWYLTVLSSTLVDETVLISASTTAGVVTYATLSGAPADDAAVLLTPPATR